MITCLGSILKTSINEHGVHLSMAVAPPGTGPCIACRDYGHHFGHYILIVSQILNFEMHHPHHLMNTPQALPNAAWRNGPPNRVTPPPPPPHIPKNTSRVHVHVYILTLLYSKSSFRRSKKTNMFSVLPLWKKGRRRRFFSFFFFFQNGRRKHKFSKTTGRPIFSRCQTYLTIFTAN